MCQGHKLMHLSLHVGVEWPLTQFSKLPCRITDRWTHTRRCGVARFRLSSSARQLSQVDVLYAQNLSDCSGTTAWVVMWYKSLLRRRSGVERHATAGWVSSGKSGIGLFSSATTLVLKTRILASEPGGFLRKFNLGVNVHF